MIRINVAAIVLAFIAAPAAAQHTSSPSSSTSTSSGSRCGPYCCDNCGGMLPPADDPVEVPAPPVALLFAAAVAALIARSRQA